MLRLEELTVASAVSDAPPWVIARGRPIPRMIERPPSEAPLFAEGGIDGRALVSFEFDNRRGTMVGVLESAVERMARSVFELYLARRVCRSAAFGLFALDHHGGRAFGDVTPAVQELWQHADAETRRAYEIRCAELFAWLEVMPP
jgi:hypothetical protein